MPHSPRIDASGVLWALDSGNGYLIRIDPASGERDEVCFLPGFARGLALHAGCAIVGLSLPRGSKVFEGLPLEDALKSRDAVARCGLLVIELGTGRMLHWLSFHGVIRELYDVQALPGVERPTALGIKADTLQMTFSFEDDHGAIVRHTLQREPATDPDVRMPTPGLPSLPPEASLSRLVVQALPLAEMAERFGAVLPRRLLLRAQQGQLADPLSLVTVMRDGKAVGVALGQASGERAEALHVWVEEPMRRAGLGTALLARLEETLARAGVRTVEATFRQKRAAGAKALLDARGWETPRAVRVLFRTDVSRVEATGALEVTRLPDGFRVLPWRELDEDLWRAVRETRDGAGAVLDPFQEPERRNDDASLVLLEGDRLVGWGVMHSTGPGTLQFTSYWLDPGVRRQGLSLPFMAEIIRHMRRERQPPRHLHGGCRQRAHARARQRPAGALRGRGRRDLGQPEASGGGLSTFGDLFSEHAPRNAELPAPHRPHLWRDHHDDRRRAERPRPPRRPLHRRRRHRPRHLGRREPRARRRRGDGLWLRPRDPVVRGLRRPEGLRPVRRVAAAGHPGSHRAPPRLHQRPADHARRRRHPQPQRGAPPEARPLRVRPPRALLRGRAFAGDRPGEGGHDHLPREHRGHLRRDRVRGRDRGRRDVQAAHEGALPRALREGPLPRHRRLRHQARLAGGHAPHRQGRAGVRRRQRPRLGHARPQGQHHEVHRGRLPRLGLRDGRRAVRRREARRRPLADLRGRRPHHHGQGRHRGRVPPADPHPPRRLRRHRDAQPQRRLRRATPSRPRSAASASPPAPTSTTTPASPSSRPRTARRRSTPGWTRSTRPRSSSPAR